MNSRRDALKTLAGATGLAAGASAQQHQHTDPPSQQAGDKPLIAIKAPKQPGFFNREEFDTVTALVDLIIPRTDTPGAVDAGVPFLIDERVPRDERLKTVWRSGIATFNSACVNKYGKVFTALDNSKRTEFLTAISMETGTSGRNFFDLVKGSTVDAYYDTREGLATELGWNANLALTSFTGCTHPEHQA